MARPRQGYVDANGEKIPSVTTVLGRFKESGGLIHWAWDCGMKGLDYRDVRDSAASAGTIAHELIRAHVFGKTYEIPGDTTEEIAGKAQEAFKAFVRWFDQSGIEIVATEQSLVSEAHRYGGTVDAIGKERDGSLCVLDWKSSKGRYPEYIVQLAAYAGLVAGEEAFGPVATAHLLWIDKETATFAHFGYNREVIERAFTAFVYLRKLYDLDKELKRLV
jgi:hypothetical protein